jgi:protease-3
MYIQTPVKGPGEMQSRFDEYKLEYKKELDAITEETFAQLKNAVLIKLNEQPKNLGDELRPYLSDWYDENFDFDSKAELIKEVEKVTLDDVKDFYNQTVLNKNAARLNVQMRGSKFADKAFGKLENQTIITDFTKAAELLDYQK